MASEVIANTILLSLQDNVVVACEQVTAGSKINVDGEIISVRDDVEVGHKIACKDIEADNKILKYGAPIGRATMSIPLGAHVHTHNIESVYLHSHTARQTPEDKS
jgi:hypothetical protein